MNRSPVIAPDPVMQARSLCEAGSWLELLEFAQAWQRESPGDARPHFYQGMALAATGCLAEAEASYRRALQLDPQSFKIWNNLGTLLFETMNRQAEGMQCLAQAMNLDPGNKLGWAKLASMNGQIGRHGQALECAERALALDAQMVEAQLHRARAAQMLGKREILQAVCEALAQLPPEKFKRVR